MNLRDGEGRIVGDWGALWQDLVRWKIRLLSVSCFYFPPGAT